MSNLTENETLYDKYRYVLAFVIDEQARITFLISGRAGVPLFLLKEIEKNFQSKASSISVYRPFHTKIDNSFLEINLDSDNYLKNFWNTEKTNTMGLTYDNSYEKNSFPIEFLDSLTGEEISQLESLYKREISEFVRLHDMLATDMSLSEDANLMTLKEVGIKKMDMDRVLSSFNNSNINIFEEVMSPHAEATDNLMKKLLEVPSFGKKKTTLFLEWAVSFAPYYRNFIMGGASRLLHSVDFVDREFFDTSREIGDKLTLSKTHPKSDANTPAQKVQKSEVVEKKEKDKTSDDSGKQDETKESRGITRNPFIWMIAIAIVVWWKWDEILGYIS